VILHDPSRTDGSTNLHCPSAQDFKPIVLRRRSKDTPWEIESSGTLETIV